MLLTPQRPVIRSPLVSLDVLGIRILSTAYSNREKKEKVPEREKVPETEKVPVDFQDPDFRIRS